MERWQLSKSRRIIFIRRLPFMKMGSTVLDLYKMWVQFFESQIIVDPGVEPEPILYFHKTGILLISSFTTRLPPLGVKIDHTTALNRYARKNPFLL
ncbi:MAG: hypothetical protein ABI359_14805 [Ginsengibacter sp.]